MKKRKILAAAVSMTMVLSMLPVTALAVEGSTPSAESISISSASGVNYSSEPDGNVLRMDIPNNAVLDLTSIGMTTSEVVALGTVSSSEANTIYADGTNLKISLSVKGVSYTVTAKMTATDGINWTGSGQMPDIEGVADLPVGALANELGNTDINVAQGVLVAGDQQSAAAKVHLNQDASKVYVYLYPASVTTHTVTYDYGSGSYVFTVPDGSQLLNAAAPALTGQDFSGWCTDAACTTPVGEGATVTDDVTVYGSYEAETGSTTFEGALIDPSTTNTLPISSKEDFAAFVARASEVAPGQLVQLQNDITLTGTYSSISGFRGDFDGNQKTITGGTFTAVNGNAGMFATLGAYNGRGQRVGNLTLNNVTVDAGSATYAGILVGSASGAETASDNFVRIQNVQVVGGTVNGRSAGGIAGFIHWTSIKYCSVTGGTTVSGTVNGGGIAGISYRAIEDCYTTVTPTAMPYFGDAGGIVGKNLEASSINHCWCVMSSLYGNNTQGGVVENSISNVVPGMPEALFTAQGFATQYWRFEVGQYPSFQENAVTMAFVEVET